jgi:hypothetical protein
MLRDVDEKNDKIVDYIREFSSNMFIRDMYNELLIMMVKINRGLKSLEIMDIEEAEKVFREILRHDIPIMKKSVLLIMSYIDTIAEISENKLRFIESLRKNH